MITIIRWLVGLLFIFSGLVKANDSVGLSYKMQEFFEAWGLHSLQWLTLPSAFAMNILEVVAGVAIIVGWQKKIFTKLLFALILFFTFLTAYVLFSGKIKACGCFGDCIPLTPNQTFGKDVALLILSIILLISIKKITPLFSNKINLLIVAVGFIGTTLFQLYTLYYLPIADCLPYKIGNNIEQQMQIPANAVPDSIVTVSIYKNNSKSIEIVGDNFPDDFDSTYQFVSRTDKLIRKGNAEPKIKDFVLYSLSGNDTTKAIFAQKEPYLLVFVKELQHPILMIGQVNDTFVQRAKKYKGLKTFIVHSSANIVGKLDTKDLNYLICDATVIRTIARANTTYLVMQGSTITNKVSYKHAERINGKQVKPFL